MSVIKKVLGKIIYAIAKAISVVMNSLIQLIETMVLFIRSITKGCLALLSMGGCLVVLLFAGPLGIRILTDPYALFTVLFFMIFPMVGAKLVSHMKYIKYVTTEFLFNLANYLIDGKNYRYKAFNEYKLAYKKAEQERQTQEQRRYYEQQRKWGEQFKQQWHQQSSQRGQGYYGGQGSYGHGYANTNVDFKTKYQKSCNVLGVAYDADKNLIKLAYRKKAKEYHPDLSKASDATKMFQEINDAYEFLSDENLQRYKTSTF